MARLPSTHGTQPPGEWSFVRTFSIADIGGTAIVYDRFGSALSMDGTWLAVSARQDNNGEVGAPSYGAVYIFQNQGGVWTHRWKKRAEVPQMNASFGTSVDIPGDLMIVGSHYEDIDGDGLNPFRQGAAYIFTFNIDGWDFTERITAPDHEHMAQFGISVGISGNHAIVGSPYKAIGTIAGAGSAYIFQRSAANEWHTIAAAVLTLATPGIDDLFGWSAAISGDTAVVGAFSRDQLATNDGAAFAYTRTTANTWELAGTVSPSDAADNVYFGTSISLDGTRATIGATDLQSVTEGAVYIFK